MCLAVSSLVYGLPVRTMSLLFAAEAWPDLQPSFRFFHLVSLRLRRGTLSSTSSAVQSLPVEVWNLVKDELVRIEVDEKEGAFVQRIAGGQSWCSLATLGEKARWADLRGSACNCDVCHEACFNFCVNLPRRVEQPVRLFLSDFGLTIPTGDLAVLRQSDADWLEFELATYLILPPADTSTATVEPLQISLQPTLPPVRGGSSSPPPKPSFVRSYNDIPVNEVKPGWAMLSTCMTKW
ncbi:hypothetical protein JCM8097_002127 [Rhodosporidiobolus ruineniae]